MSKLGNFLEYCDWITPAVSLVQHKAGKVKTFYVPREQADDTVRLLVRKGIKMKNTSYLPDNFIFDVDVKDARKVERLLGI